MAYVFAKTISGDLFNCLVVPHKTLAVSSETRLLPGKETELLHLAHYFSQGQAFPQVEKPYSLLVLFPLALHVLLLFWCESR